MIGSLMACLCLLTTTSFAAPVLVSIDVSSLLGHEISLEFQLFENGGEFDSVVKVDNVSLDGTLHDFEAANALDVWHSFPDPLDPAVTRKGGTINGAGSSIMEIAEGFPTLASTDFSAITITGPTLSFYLDAAMSGVVLPSPTPGQVIYFLDEFIVFIYDLTIDDYAIKDPSENNLPILHLIFRPSLAVPQSRNPQRRTATLPVSLNRSRPNTT